MIITVFNEIYEAFVNSKVFFSFSKFYFQFGKGRKQMIHTRYYLNEYRGLFVVITINLIFTKRPSPMSAQPNSCREFCVS